MSELEDYSGEFQANLDTNDLSKEALTRLIALGGMLYAGLAGVYFRLLRERLGEQMAMELDREAWNRMAPIEIRMSAEAMNIKGNDVATVLKILQSSPADAAMGILTSKYEIKTRDYGVVTYTDCPSLSYIEKYQETALYEHVCAGICVNWFTQCARFVNPGIKAIPLKLPPRSSPDDIACSWGFKIE